MFNLNFTNKVVISLAPKLSDQVDKLLEALSGGLSAEDQDALNNLLSRESDEAARLEALDAKN